MKRQVQVRGHPASRTEMYLFKSEERKSIYMRRHGKIVFVFLMAVCLMLTMMPSMAFAAEDGVETPAVNAEVENSNTEENAGTTTPDSGNQDSAQTDVSAPDYDQEGAIPDSEQESDDETQEAEEVLPGEENMQKSMLLLNAASDTKGTFADGDTISYKSADANAGGGREVRSFTVTSEGGADFSGACAEIGVSAAKKGSATISPLNDRTKKLLYKYAVKAGWWSGSKSTKKATALKKGTIIRYKEVVAMITQIGEQGKGWIDDAVDGGGWDRSAAKDWYNTVKDLDVSDVELPPGFEAYKCTCPKGDQNFVIWSYKEPEPEPGQVRLFKNSTATVELFESDAYSLEGARYQVYKDAACTNPATTVDGQNALLTTEDNGTTEPITLALGNYYLKEIAAPDGHLIDSTPVPFSVTAESGTGNTLKNGESINYTGVRDGANNTIGQTAIFSAIANGVTYTGTCRQLGVSMATSGTGTVAERISNDSRLAKLVYKYGILNEWWQGKNAHNSANGVLGTSSTCTLQRLIEAALQINYQGANSWKSLWGEAANQKALNAIINWVNTADVSGVTVPDNFEMYNINPAGNAQKFTIWALTEVSGEAMPVTLSVSDEPIYGAPNLRVFKTAKTGNFEWKDLAGAKFVIKYYDVANKADIASAIPARKWTFTTIQKDAPQGAAAGTYWAGFDWRTDTPVDAESDEFYKDEGGNRVLPAGWFTIEEAAAPSGFKLTTEKCYGHIYQVNNGAPATTVIEGAVSDSKLHMETYIFEDEPYKTIVSKKNSVTGDEFAGAQLQVLQGTTVVKPTWTTTTTPKSIEGLSPGTYTLREVKAPYGYELANDVTFTVDGKSDKKVTMTNTPVTVGTTAVSKATGKHVGTRKTNEKITDTVHMTGLVKDRKYRLTGTLMNKRTGTAVPDVTVSPKEFTATAEAMDVTMDFTFDSTTLADGDSVVVFETLCRTSSVHSGETVPSGGVELAKHHNINDSAQTVIYPGISTTAVDKTTGTKNMLAAGNAVIKDTVSYKGLAVGEAYTLEGELFDKTTNRLTGIKKTAILTATSASGTAEITFSLDASGLENHTLVVYETLKLNGEILTEHKNPNDTAQTIYIPEVKTTLTDDVTGDHLSNAEGTVKLNDSVVCSNLIVGKTYTIEGKLVYKDSGNDVLDNGKTVTAAKTFTASQTTETQILTFTFNGRLLEGKTVVAFEDLLTERKKVGTHSDLTDKEQSVHFPKIRTTAAISDDNHVFTDTISYENLLPGRKYVFRGWLVDTTTGTKIEGSDGKVEVTATETNVNGSVKMRMNTAGYDTMKGHSMTAYEELYVIEKTGDIEKEISVAEHKDRSGNASTNPQTIEIYQDLKVQKNVTGNLGDLTKVFEYTVEFTDLVPNTEYKVEGDDAKTFKAGADGKATLDLRLADDQSALIKQLPKSATYVVTEAASDHIAQYRMFSEDMEKKGAKIVTKEANNGAEAAKILATAKETVDLFDGTIVVLWENNRDIATLTGVRTNLGIWAGALALVLAGILPILARRRRYVSEDQRP